MDTLFLISTLALGGIWCIVLVVVCFIGVHLVKLAKIGFDVTKDPPKQPTNKEKISDGQKPSDTKPVYCFVERRKQGKTTVYSKPKRLRFK